MKGIDHSPLIISEMKIQLLKLYNQKKHDKYYANTYFGEFYFLEENKNAQIN